MDESWFTPTDENDDLAMVKTKKNLQHDISFQDMDASENDE